MAKCYVFFFVLLTMAVPLSARQESGTLALSLEQALALATENNTDLQLAEYQRASSAFAFREAKGAFLPKATLNSSYYRNIDKQVIFLPEEFGRGGATEIGSDNNFNTALNLSMPLYSRLNITGRELAFGNFQLQTEMRRGVRQALLADVKKSYVAHLVALAVVEVRVKGLEISMENYSATRDKVLQGVATEFDETSARVKVAIARNNLLEARSNLTPTANKLKLLVGLPIGRELHLTDSLFLSEEERSLAPRQEELLTGNSMLKQQELRVAIARQQTQLSKAQWFPQLGAVGSYQFQSQENDFNITAYEWVKTSSVGINLQLPLFNGMVTHNRVQQAMIGEKMAEIQQSFREESNRSQFQQLQVQLQYAMQRILLQEENIQVAQKALALVRERYHYGKSTLLEVNNAELEYISAQLGYLQAIADYKSWYYDFELLTGVEK